ncbi:MAG TPA: RNA polymerase sigma factor [Polyangia bacterium]|jgi:RNA polymerase sigma-70 factor (ECF subfamily)
MAVELGEAFRRHRGTLTAAAMRVLRRHDDVDDVLQDAFVAALRSVHNLREPAALRAWLTRVTVRTARRRGARAWFVALEDAPAAAHVPDPRPSALDLALLAAVGEVVAAIPADRCRPWALRMVDGEPIDDIAACCGCSATTVKRRIAEVRGLLEAALE